MSFCGHVFVLFCSQARGFETTVESRLARVELRVAALDAAVVRNVPDAGLSEEVSVIEATGE